MIEVAVTGTDTGVGKTVVACAIAAGLRRRGMSVGVMKPVETGVSPGAIDRDAAHLREAAGSERAIDQIAPYTFVDPVAPLLAARQAGITIDLSRLDAALDELRASHDAVIVEGAGGLLVPIAPRFSFATLFHRWGLPIVVVAPNRLGVINHVMLTVAAARQASISVNAIVLREPEGLRSDQSSTSNVAVLRELLPTLPVLEFPWVFNPRDRDALARAAEASGLVGLLAPFSG